MQERDFAAVIEAQEDNPGGFADKSIGDEDILDWKVRSCVSFVVMAKKKYVLCSIMERLGCWPTLTRYVHFVCSTGMLFLKRTDAVVKTAKE